MHINEIKAKSPQQLLKMAEDMGIEEASQLNVQQLRFAVMRGFAADKKITLIGDGVLERLQDGFGFLRAPESNYLAGPDDLYVSPNLIKKYGLKTGDYVEGQIQAPQNESERYFALETIERVNGGEPEKLRHRVSFDDMDLLIALCPVQGEPSDRFIMLDAVQRAGALFLNQECQYPTFPAADIHENIGRCKTYICKDPLEKRVVSGL